VVFYADELTRFRALTANFTPVRFGKLSVSTVDELMTIAMLGLSGNDQQLKLVERGRRPKEPYLQYVRSTTRWI
jgi:hypothetical protein